MEKPSCVGEIQGGKSKLPSYSNDNAGFKLVLPSGKTSLKRLFLSETPCLPGRARAGSDLRGESFSCFLSQFLIFQVLIVYPVARRGQGTTCAACRCGTTWQSNPLQPRRPYGTPVLYITDLHSAKQEQETNC